MWMRRDPICSSCKVTGAFKAIFEPRFERQRSLLVPGYSTRVWYSLGTNLNTPFIQVPTLEFGRGAGARGTKVGIGPFCARVFC